MTAVPAGQSSSAWWSPLRALLVAHSAFTDPRSRLSPAHPAFLEHIRAPSLVGGSSGSSRSTQGIQQTPRHQDTVRARSAVGQVSQPASRSGWVGWVEVGHRWASSGALPRLPALRRRRDCRSHGAGVTVLGFWRPHPQVQQELKPGWRGLLSASLLELAWTRRPLGSKERAVMASHLLPPAGLPRVPGHLPEPISLGSGTQSRLAPARQAVARGSCRVG